MNPIYNVCVKLALGNEFSKTFPQVFLPNEIWGYFFVGFCELEQVKEERDRENEFYDIPYKTIIRNNEGKILAQCKR